MGSNPRWRRRVSGASTEALGRVLDAAEDASPLEAIKAVTRSCPPRWRRRRRSS
jgi:hypothetical protein